MPSELCVWSEDQRVGRASSLPTGGQGPARRERERLKRGSGWGPTPVSLAGLGESSPPAPAFLFSPAPNGAGFQLCTLHNAEARLPGNGTGRGRTGTAPGARGATPGSPGGAASVEEAVSLGRDTLLQERSRGSWG